MGFAFFGPEIVGLIPNHPPKIYMYGEKNKIKRQQLGSSQNTRAKSQSLSPKNGVDIGC